jgi:hypothetical protein
MNAFSIRGWAGAWGVAGDGLTDVFAAVAPSTRENAGTPKVINQTANPILHLRDVFIAWYLAGTLMPEIAPEVQIADSHLDPHVGTRDATLLWKPNPI